MNELTAIAMEKKVLIAHRCGSEQVYDFSIKFSTSADIFAVRQPLPNCCTEWKSNKRSTEILLL